MNVKFAFTLILVLQVSLSLCEIPPPDQELIEKYNALKSTFYKRLLNLYGKVQSAATPVVDKISDHEHGQAAKQLAQNLMEKPELQAVVKVATGIGEEAAPLVDQARSAVLSAYGTYLRPHIGSQLSNAIDSIKVYLDKFLPAE